MAKIEYEDELYGDAVKTCQEYGQLSVSILQCRLRIGYFRAAALIDRMESDKDVNLKRKAGQ